MFSTLAPTDVKDYLAIAAEVADALTASAAKHDSQAGMPYEEVAALKQSGLLLLPVPREYGGAGATWPEVYQVVRILASAQGSIGQIYANHITLLHAGAVLGRPGQAEQYYRMTAQNNLLWANALNARDARLKIRTDGDQFRVDGVKSFGTGIAVADFHVVAALEEATNTPYVFTVSRGCEGMAYNDDWDNMGQRRTVSGSYRFDAVQIAPDALVGPPAVPPESAFPTLIFILSQLSKVCVYLGITEGALAAAKQYTLAETRPWQASGVDHAAQDPYILRRYGEYWAELQAAIALAEQAATQVQTAWEKGAALTFEERGESAIAISAAKVVAIKTGLKITSEIFDVMGSRATASRYGFDRFWRDMRTFSLHDPADYKYKDIGNWLLNQEYPMPSQYS